VVGGGEHTGGFSVIQVAAVAAILVSAIRGADNGEANTFTGCLLEDHTILMLAHIHAKQRITESVEAALQIVGLRDFADSYPATLSGGMAQRASLARALVNRPRLFLLDEPLGKLDALTRLQLQDEILKLWESHPSAALLGPHGGAGARRLSNRVVVLSERPAHIVADIEVPEHDESSEEVRELRREILSLLGR